MSNPATATEDPESKQPEMNGYAHMNGLEPEIADCRESIAEFVDETNNIRTEYGLAIKRINDAFKDVDSVFNKHKRQVKKFKERKNVMKELREVYAHDPLSITALEEMDGLLLSSTPAINEIGQARRKTGSLFLRMIMGRVSLKVWNEKDRVEFKKEYNRFKELVVWIFFLFPTFQIIFGWSLLVHQLQSMMTMYVYLTMAIRENILKLNGSRIEPWWIYHHYLSMGSALLLSLVSPEHPLAISGGFQAANYFMFWQGTVMALQVQYQRGRHYAHKVIGRKTKLDPRTTEVLNERPQDWYAVLIPCLYLTYFFQYCLGLSFLYTCLTSEWTSRESESGFVRVEYYQMWILSMIWFALPTGNLLTLLRVLYQKNELKKSLPFGLGKYLVTVLEIVFRDDAAKKLLAKKLK